MTRDVAAKAQIPRLEIPGDYDDPELDLAARSLYARLAAEGPLDVEALSGPALGALLSCGLVVVSAGRADAVSPSGPLLAMAERHAQRAVAAGQTLDDLMAVWRTARAEEVGVEVLSGAAAVRQYRHSLATAEREILALAIGPRAGGAVEPAPGVLDALERGVNVRAVYHSRVFESEAALSVAELCIAAGERARVFPGVPVNLVIIDDIAMMNVSYECNEPIHLACARNRRIVDSWRAIFDAFWRQAMPIDTRNIMAQVPQEFRDLVRLLSLGLTDRAIARELGVSERTIGRRVTRLQEHLGADTRFQLGLQIATRGWV